MTKNWFIIIADADIPQKIREVQRGPWSPSSGH